MNTAGKENLNHWANASSNRALGASVQNSSCSITWAAKQENVQPAEMCFFLTSIFIELVGNFARQVRVGHFEKGLLTVVSLYELSSSIVPFLAGAAHTPRS